ncbi:lipase family protein [Tateyamaria sp. SN6-1]|uniref:lipase family protein n=1 Tax=Tateyamaria sp. SN6-1 TaxID=3092148 RepID=UPI0039F55879
MTFNMHGRNAAIIAEGAYAVAAAKDSTSDNVKRDADLFAQREDAFDPDSQSETKLSVPVTPMEAVVSQSGGFVKESAGFGVLLERNGAQDGEYIFAMRGTTGKMGISNDWISNYQIGLTRGPTGSLVHSGFMDIYSKMRSDVQRMISGANPKRIHFIGHSLGGALATLAAVDYAQNGTATSHLYTFGAPRIGSLGLGNDVVRMIGAERIKRVYSISDPVPMIPLTPFCHVGPGSIGFVDGNAAFSGQAHSMKDNYIPKMPMTGWPPESRMSSKSDPGYWLTQAESQLGIGSSLGYFFLAKALKAILYAAAHIISATITIGFTLADVLVELIRSGARFASKVGDYLLKFAKLALKFAGAAVRGALTVADLTVSFLRYVLDMVLRPIRIAASAAMNVIT